MSVEVYGRVCPIEWDIIRCSVIEVASSIITTDSTTVSSTSISSTDILSIFLCNLHYLQDLEYLELNIILLSVGFNNSIYCRLCRSFLFKNWGVIYDQVLDYGERLCFLVAKINS